MQDMLGFQAAPRAGLDMGSLGSRKDLAEKPASSEWKKLAKLCPSPGKRAAYKSAVRKGVPHELRPQLWLALSGALAKQASALPGYYSGLTAAGQLTAGVPADVVRQVDTDTRTLPSNFRAHASFLQPETISAHSRILFGLLRHNTQLVYGRPLCHIVAFSMVVLGGHSQEESAFWLVAALLEDTLFPYCGGKWQWGVRVEQGVLEQLVARKLPRLATHLASLRCDLAAITGHWLPSLLLAALPPATCVRVWDCVMVEGPKVLLRVGLALLKTWRLIHPPTPPLCPILLQVYELTVTSVTSPDVLRKVLDLRVARSNDAEELLATAFRGIGSLSGTFVSGLRASVIASLTPPPAHPTSLVPAPVPGLLPSSLLAAHTLGGLPHAVTQVLAASSAAAAAAAAATPVHPPAAVSVSAGGAKVTASSVASKAAAAASSPAAAPAVVHHPGPAVVVNLKAAHRPRPLSAPRVMQHRRSLSHTSTSGMMRAGRDGDPLADALEASPAGPAGDGGRPSSPCSTSSNSSFPSLASAPGLGRSSQDVSSSFGALLQGQRSVTTAFSTAAKRSSQGLRTSQPVGRRDSGVQSSADSVSSAARDLPEAGSAARLGWEGLGARPLQRTMGKSKGGKYFKPPRKPRPPGAGADDDASSSEEEDKKFQQGNRGLRGQTATAGMLPPSGSDSEDEPAPAKPAPKPAPKPAAKKPADSDSDESSSEDESSSSDDAPVNDYLSGPRVPKKVASTTEERDPETIRKDLERLELIRAKREQDRAKRIAAEGWDRFAPVSDTNRSGGRLAAYLQTTLACSTAELVGAGRASCDCHPLLPLLAAAAGGSQNSTSGLAAQRPPTSLLPPFSHWQ
ncbi:hypothetical protein QJQ45_016685 [Haematococcus lacustris]|nr:hypothetical protein QJQ45_016685 [Haematococcus lacustris]